MLTSLIKTRLVYGASGPTHFCLHVAAMRLPDQEVVREVLEVTCADGHDPWLREFTDGSGNRRLRFDAPPGLVYVDYEAEVRRHEAPSLNALCEATVSQLPDELLRWLTPTRYCEVDRLSGFAIAQFGQAPPGVPRVEAVMDWIRSHIAYAIGSSDATTTAYETFESKAGVCRDYAHLAITLLRALNIPARFVVGYVAFSEPPQDYHAIIEVWLGRWVAFDPSGMAPSHRLVRVGIGTDAKDVAFGTLYGAVTLQGMEIDVTEIDGRNGQRVVGDSSTYILPIPQPMLPAARAATSTASV